MVEIKNWKTECLIQHKLTEEDLKGKSTDEIKEIYDNAWKDYKRYSELRLGKSQINIFGYRYVKSHSETRRKKDKFDGENPEYHKHVKENLDISREKCKKK